MALGFFAKRSLGLFARINEFALQQDTSGFLQKERGRQPRETFLQKEPLIFLQKELGFL